LRGKNKDVWYGRFRDDVAVLDGPPKRVNRNVRLGTREELPTKRLPQRALDRHLDQINDMHYRPLPKLTFGGFVKQWERDYLPTMKPGSQDTAKSYLKNHLLPFFENMLLSNITPQVVQRFVSSRDVAPSTMIGVYGILRGIWRTAKAWGKVAHDPFPRKSINLPDVMPTNREPFTPEETQRLIENAAEPHRTLYWLIAETGIRIGEALALQLADIDFEAGVVRVRKNMNRHHGFGTPKSRKGYRSPVLSPELLAHLRQRYTKPEEFLFPGPKGSLTYHRVVEKLHELCKKLGIKTRGFHCFRYANGTLLVALGTDVKTLQTRLGHADAALSVELYSRQVGAAERALAAKLGAVFAPKCTQAVAAA